MDIEGTVEEPLGLNIGTEASDTHYYIIALGNSAAPTVSSAWFVTEANYASFTTGDLPAGFTDFKRMGSIRNNGASDFLLGEYFNGKFYFLDIVATTISISSASFVDIVLSTIIPLVAREAQCGFTSSSSTTTAKIRSNGSSVTGIPLWESAAAGSASLNVLLDAAQTMEGQISSPPFKTQVVFYVDDLENEGQ